jgi:hypothetical protein
MELNVFRVQQNRTIWQSTKVNLEYCIDLAKIVIFPYPLIVKCGIQGRHSSRTPASVLARHYSDYSPEVLKKIYERTALKH